MLPLQPLTASATATVTTDDQNSHVPPSTTAISIIPATTSVATAAATTTTATTAPCHVAGQNNRDGSSTTTTLTLTIIIPTSGDVASVLTCPHCDPTFHSPICLVGHLRIHHTAAGEPLSGALAYTHRPVEFPSSIASSIARPPHTAGWSAT
nr:unnamed protein product [Spirometra erinaceieuropaei]